MFGFSDAALEGAVVTLVIAVLGLIVSQVWQSCRERKERRARDRAILSALLREVAVIGGIAGNIVRDLNKERAMLAAQSRWRLKPLMRFPTSTYGLIRSAIPGPLLKQERAVSTIALLQAQCEYTNALSDQYQVWKLPGAREEPDQIETILSFHDSIAESVTTVVTRCEELRPQLRAAGDSIGGLNLEGAPSAQGSDGE